MDSGKSSANAWADAYCLLLNPFFLTRLPGGDGSFLILLLEELLVQIRQAISTEYKEAKFRKQKKKYEEDILQSSIEEV